VPEPIIPSVVLCGTALARAGSAAQQSEYLVPMMEGKTTLALCHAEAKSRYNVSCVSTHAKASGKGYTLAGHKLWAVHADAADQLLVSARTAGEVGDRAGVSLFVVDPKSKGVAIKPLNTIDGRRAAHVDLEGVQLGSEALIGEADAAALLLDELMDLGAAAVCAEGAGLLEAAFEMTREYLCDREQFGAKIGSFQALQHRAVDMFIELQLAKATMLLAALKVGEPDLAARQRAISTAKVQLAQSGNFVTRQAIQLHGGIGVTDEHDVGLYYKRMLALNVLFGDELHHTERFAALS
jgi:alkylation response protein AidB-like acyl-CoA dehydrogenase